MAKRKIETELDELSEELLEDLDHRERFALLLKTNEDDREHWRERLVETIPEADYRGVDPAYRRRAYVLLTLSERAVYELHTRFLEYQVRQTEALHYDLAELLEDDEIETPDSGSPFEDESSPGERLGDLYLEYHAYRRFAEQVIGVDLETWVAGHPNGQAVVAVIEDTLERFSEEQFAVDEDLPAATEEMVDLSNEWLPDTLPEAALDRLVLVQYQELVAIYQETLERGSVQTGYLGL